MRILYRGLCLKLWFKIRSNSGIGTIEIVVILGILLGLALLFRQTVTEFVTDLMDEFFDARKFK